MNTELAFEIVQLALSILKSERGGKNAQIAESLLAIVRKGLQAYWQQTGQPLDPSLIRVEEPI